MSLRGTIRRRDNAPLGTEEEVMRHLSDAFPGTWFFYEAEEPLGAVEATRSMSVFLRLWLFFFGLETRYPNHRGYFEPADRKSVVEFYFPAGQVVPWVEATSYGMTAGLDANFDRLSAATGWEVVY